MLLLLQLLILDAATAYLLLWCEEMRQRSHCGWERLVSRIRFDARPAQWGDPVLAMRELGNDACQIWQCAPGFRGLRVAFHNAGVVLAMADFAERNGLPDGSGQSGLDPQVLTSLRRHALEIRSAIFADCMRLVRVKSLY